MATIREDSRKEWSSGSTIQEIQAGAPQRIADATEIMSKSYRDLHADNDWFRKRHQQDQATINRLVRSNNALRGHINRMKKQK